METEVAKKKDVKEFEALLEESFKKKIATFSNKDIRKNLSATVRSKF